MPALGARNDGYRQLRAPVKGCSLTCVACFGIIVFLYWLKSATLMTLGTAYYDRCIQTLEKAYSLLKNVEHENIDYDMYRSACVKEFEIILEQSGKLWRKIIKPYFHSSKAVDDLHFKDVFRHAVKHGLLDAERCQHWLQYRDNRNSTSHDYSANFAEETLVLLPQFIADAKALSKVVNQQTNN